MRGAAAASFRSSRAQHPSRPAGTHHAAPMTQSARAREMPKLANAKGSTWLKTSCQFELNKASFTAAAAAAPEDEDADMFCLRAAGRGGGKKLRGGERQREGGG